MSDWGCVAKDGVIKKLQISKKNRVTTTIHRGPYKSLPTLVHRLVLQTFRPNPNPEFFDRVDHIDQNPLHNRLENLRWSNGQLNRFNVKLHKGYVKYKTKSGMRYRTQMNVGRTLLCLGTFKTPEEAHARYVEACRDALDILDPYQIY